MTARVAAMARWLAVFGLLLHMAVPMAHTPPALIAALASAHATDATGHSAHGHHDASRAAAGQNTPQPAKPGHDRPMQCPICQALHLGGPALAPAAFVVRAPEISGILFEASLSDFAAERFATPLQARAPPITG